MKLIIVILVILFTSPAYAKHKHLERWYQYSHCKGVKDDTLSDGTEVDCLTNRYAIEYDFGPNWYNALGQCLHYARLTSKSPGIVLILENKKDLRYYKRLNDNIKFWKLPITVWLIKNY